MANAVDTAAFHPASHESGGRLLNVAALADKKGHEHLLRAMTGHQSVSPAGVFCPH